MNLQENIARMEQELADMKKQLEQDKLELKLTEGYGFYSSNGTIIGPNDIDNDSPLIQRGMARATKELAEIADKNMVTRNRLEAYVHQIQGDGEGNRTISFMNGRYYTYSRIENRYPLCTVFMRKETAEILCKSLNKGEIEL